MNVVRTLQVVVALLALMAGLATTAFAHAGHAHTGPTGAPTSASYSPTSDSRTKSQHAVPLLRAHSSEKSGLTDFAVENPSSGTIIVRCTPGSCCCQGASSCGAGHCCSLGMTTTQPYGLNQREAKSFQLALLGWPYPDLIFGLDRPPKV